MGTHPLATPATIDLAAVWGRESSPLVDGFIDSARAAIAEAAVISR